MVKTASAMLSVGTVLNADPTYYISLTKSSLPADVDGYLLPAAVSSTLRAYVYMQKPGATSAVRPDSTGIWLRAYRVVGGVKSAIKTVENNVLSLIPTELSALQSYSLDSIEIQAFTDSACTKPLCPTVSIGITRAGDTSVVYDIVCTDVVKPEDEYVNVYIRRTEGQDAPVQKWLSDALDTWGVELSVSNTDVSVEESDSQLDLTGANLTSGSELILYARIDNTLVAQKTVRVVADGADAESYYLVSNVQSVDGDSDGYVYRTTSVTVNAYKKVGTGDAEMATVPKLVLRKIVGSTSTTVKTVIPGTSLTYSISRNTVAQSFVCHAYDDNNVDICPPLVIPIIKTGEQGDMNVRPIVYRITEWQAGVEYRNDTEVTATDTDRYIDIVTVGVNGSAEPNMAFIYKNQSERSGGYQDPSYSSHTSTDGDYSSSNVTGCPTTSDGTPFWLAYTSMNMPLMAPLAYFVKAIIQYLQVGQITFVQNGVVKGAIGYSDLGAPLYLGGASAELANFRVSYDGELYCVGADISGTLRVTNSAGEEKVLVSADTISQGVLVESTDYESFASTGVSRDPNRTVLTYTGAIASYDTTIPAGCCLQGSINLTLSYLSGSTYYAATLNYNARVRATIGIYEGTTLLTSTEYDSGSSTSLSCNNLDITPSGLFPYLCPTAKTLTVKVSNIRFTQTSTSNNFYYSETFRIVIGFHLAMTAPQKIRIAPNGIYVGAGYNSWLYADENRMELRTGNHGIRTLIGGSATGNIEGVQILRELSNGSTEWMSIYGKAVTITASYTVTRDIRYIVSTASSNITITLPNTTYNGHEVFVKKFGAGTVTLKGAAGNIVVQANSTSLSESYTLTTSPAALVVFVNGLWFVMRGST